MAKYDLRIYRFPRSYWYPVRSNRAGVHRRRDFFCLAVPMFWQRATANCGYLARSRIKKRNSIEPPKYELGLIPKLLFRKFQNAHTIVPQTDLLGLWPLFETQRSQKTNELPKFQISSKSLRKETKLTKIIQKRKQHKLTNTFDAMQKRASLEELDKHCKLSTRPASSSVCRLQTELSEVYNKHSRCWFLFCLSYQYPQNISKC